MIRGDQSPKGKEKRTVFQFQEKSELNNTIQFEIVVLISFLELCSMDNSSGSNFCSEDASMEDSRSQETTFNSLNIAEEDATLMNSVHFEEHECSNDDIKTSFLNPSLHQATTTNQISRRSFNLQTEILNSGKGLGLLVRTVSKKFPINRGKLGILTRLLDVNAFREAISKKAKKSPHQTPNWA